ncbi:MAG: hypothetical protein A2V70_13735 [Planctomycetes bacterium RBG_13_63_9]|nr:MAG: hypothetical protein A2V70_13735 [Planctomycetes bacterium RBG_13_63_9]
MRFLLLCAGFAGTRILGGFSLPMAWLDMTRDCRRCMVFVGLTVVLCLSTAAQGQLLKRSRYMNQPVSALGKSSAGATLVEETDAGARAAMVTQGRPVQAFVAGDDLQTAPPTFDEVGVAVPASDSESRYGTLTVEGDYGGPASVWSRLDSALHPPSRHRGLGHPLQQESWLYRPFSAGWFMGMVQGGPLIDDWVGQKQGFVGGYRLGWDQDYYWGGEMQFAFASIRVYDSPRAITAALEADPAGHERFDHRRDAALFQWDASVLHYPWGDSQWRPYLRAGLGTARVRFDDRLSRHYDKTVLAMPLAVGMKYRCNDWLALRFECADNIAFGGGSGFDTVHNLTLTGGAEIRFGGTRKAYWPWNPGRTYW